MRYSNFARKVRPNAGKVNLVYMHISSAEVLVEPSQGHMLRKHARLPMTEYKV